MNNDEDTKTYNKQELDETKVKFRKAWNKVILISIVIVSTLNPTIIISGVIFEQILFIVVGVLSCAYGIFVIIYFGYKINRILKLNDEEITKEKLFQKFMNSKANNN